MILTDPGTSARSILSNPKSSMMLRAADMVYTHAAKAIRDRGYRRAGVRPGRGDRRWGSPTMKAVFSRVRRLETLAPPKAAPVWDRFAAALDEAAYRRPSSLRRANLTTGRQ
jgi:hypothetical protein